MADLDIEPIDARANAATPGPWVPDIDDGAVYTGKVEAPTTGAAPAFVFVDRTEAAHAADVEFIAHAREDVPALVAEVRRLRTALAPPVDDGETMGETLLAVCRSLRDERQLTRRMAARIAKLRAALEFYADANDCSPDDDDVVGVGARARAALKEDES